MKKWAPFVAISLLVPACALVPTPAPSEELPLHPATPPPEAMLEPLGEILILRAYSGPFVSHEERNLLAAPDLVVFDDGLVVADTRPFVSEPPEFRSIQLTPDEQDELMEQLAAAELSPLAAGGPVGGTFCFDCPTTIIRTDIGGETIEIAAFGLLTDVTERYVSALPYPPGLIAVDRLLDGLVDRVRAAESDPFDRSLPEVPVSEMGGG